MLNDLLRIVNSRGWFDTTEPFEYSINFTRASCVWLLLMRHGRGERHVKFSQVQSLSREALRSKEASLRYPDLAPRFVGYAETEGFQILTCDAVDALTVTPREALRSSRGRALLTSLGSYFDAMSGVAPASAASLVLPLRNRQLAETLSEYFRGGSLAREAARWILDPAASIAYDLPDIPQHCDFVLNNIGRRRPNGAAIFDWEDFGESSLPGLDLFTLEMSLTGEKGRLVELRRADDPGLRDLKRRCCQSLGLSVADYHALTPIYALVFRFLKRNYSFGIRGRMDRVLGDLRPRAVEQPSEP